MILAETVVAGAPNPGTEPEVMSSPAGYYIGYRDEDGMPYSRETEYVPNVSAAEQQLSTFLAAVAVSLDEAKKLPFVRGYQ